MTDFARLREALRSWRENRQTESRMGCRVEDASWIMAEIVRAAEMFESTLPKTEEIEVWHVEYWDTQDSRARVLVFVTKRNALDWAANFLPRDGALPRVTGPHKHMRPL